jgi:hypothetical protein
VPGNEKGDEWAKLAAEEPGAYGSNGRQAGDATPTIPRPPEARDLGEEVDRSTAMGCEPITARKYKIQRKQYPDRTIASSDKRTASRFDQLKTGRALTGQYLEWTKNCPDPKCGLCQYKHQTREHLFGNCPKWKGQQKIPRAEVRKETRRGKGRSIILDHSAGERCSQAILCFIATTQARRSVPDATEDDVQSEAPEWALLERYADRCKRDKELEAEGGSVRSSSRVPALFAGLPTIMGE